MATIVNKTALVDSLQFNNRFGNKKLMSKDIGAEDMHNWKQLITNLHKAAYDVYVLCQNEEPTEEDLTGLDLTAVFDALREVYTQIGEVNGHKMYVTAKAATLIIGKSGTGNGNEYHPDLQFAMSKKSNAQTYLHKLSKIEGVNPEALDEQQRIIEAADEEIAALKNQPDMWKKVPTRTKPEAFRADVERYIANVIKCQKAKTWEQLEAEEAARKEAKKQKRQQKRQAAAAARAAEEAENKAECDTVQALPLELTV